MNRLQLCQRYAREAGFSGASNGTLPASTLNQQGEMLTVVSDIDAAYEALQNKKPNWEFLRQDFSFQTISGTSTYTPTDAGAADHKRWKTDTFKMYLTSAGQSTEQDITYIPWDRFRYVRLFGATATQSGEPLEFSIKPNKSIIFWPNPDAIYTARGEYYQKADVMTANDDEPLMPDDFHLILVWSALMKYGRREAAPEAYALGLENYNEIWPALKGHQLPAITTAGPMV